MSPLVPFQKWTLRAGIAVALTVTLTVVSFPRVAHADLGEEPKSSSGGAQVEDADKPKDGSLLEKKPADAAVQQQAAAPQVAFYEKWQFWAITGGIVAGGLLAYFGGKALYHSLNGGDVRPCNPMFQTRCFGEGH